MSDNTVHLPTQRISAALSVAIFVVAVTLMGWLRLYIYPDRFVTLTYGLPLLVCLWHRDRRLVWGMTTAFVVMSFYKAFVLLPRVYGSASISQWVMQLINLLVTAGSVHLIINLLERIKAKTRELLHINEELAAREEEISRQNEEMQVQSEELAQQNEELQQQSEEMQQQSEELQAQSEELQTANSELKQREAILQSLLESLRYSESDATVLAGLCESALKLQGDAAQAAMVVERAGENLALAAASGHLPAPDKPISFQGSFTQIIMAENRTAYIEDLRKRPDLDGFAAVNPAFRSVLCTPLRSGATPIGAVKMYSLTPQRWTTEHFRIIEWVAGQCSLILEVRRLRAELTQANADLERIVRERTARLQEMVDELEHFSYSITHDMRAPLRAMQGFAEMLEVTGSAALDESERKDYLQRIINAARRMDRLIIDALSYSRSVQHEMTVGEVDPRRLLGEMIESYPEFQAPRAQIELDEKIPPVLANEAGLTQCFSNLLNNAVKFVDRDQRPQVKVYAERRDGLVRIWFEDNGIGIPRELVPRMFGMFQRGSHKFEGTGIGLALVRKVTERMGGKVGVEAAPEKGSRFWVELKAANPGEQHV